MITDRKIYSLSTRLGAVIKKKNKFITCAESCTGGWISKTITDVSGSASWFEFGFVTYSNQAKIELLGVSPQTIEKYGAVSNQVVLEMAHGALKTAGADYAVATSGIAGPNGNMVGTVWFGFSARDGGSFSQLRHFEGNRNSVRRQSVHFVLNTLLTTFI